METTSGAEAKEDVVKQRIRQFANAYFEKPHLGNLAETCGIHYMHLVKMNEKASPTMKLLRQFQEKADMSIDWFISGKGPMRFSERFDYDQYDKAQKAINKEKAVTKKAMEEAAALLEDSRKLHKKIEEVSKLLKKGR